MRIAVSGTHCSGKTTLVEAFVSNHPDYVHEPEPYEWLMELHDEVISAEPTGEEYLRQLSMSVERLSSYPPGAQMIAERSPLDFLAYLKALTDLGREDCSPLIDRVWDVARRGMQHLDVLVVLPLNERDGIEAPESEDPELREAMNEALLELLDDTPGPVGSSKSAARGKSD